MPTTYPDAVPVPRGEVPTGTPRKAANPRAVRNFDEPEPGVRPKPKVVVHLAVKKNRDGPASGDNSNSQYAALGVRACHDARAAASPPLIRLTPDAWIGLPETLVMFR